MCIRDRAKNVRVAKTEEEHAALAEVEGEAGGIARVAEAVRADAEPARTDAEALPDADVRAPQPALTA